MSIGERQLEAGWGPTPPAPPGVLWKHDAKSLARCYAAAQTYYVAVKAVGGSWHSNSQVEAEKCNALVRSYVSVVTTASDWTQWLDRDDPTSNGDGEHLSLFAPMQVYPKPLLAECRRISHQVASNQTGENTVCSVTQGGYCNNAEHNDGLRLLTFARWTNQRMDDNVALTSAALICGESLSLLAEISERCVAGPRG